jgi:hypothetical protein
MLKIDQSSLIVQQFLARDDDNIIRLMLQYSTCPTILLQNCVCFSDAYRFNLQDYKALLIKRNIELEGYQRLSLL